jgi:hypothetical protein
MQIRILAGCKRLLTAAALASLTFVPAAADSAKAAPAATPQAAKFGAAPVQQQQQQATKLRQPALYPRSNYVWPFATGPMYGEVDSSRWNDPGVLHTIVGSFDLTRGLPNFPTELRSTNKLGKVAAQFFVLQVQPQSFADGSFDQIKSAIAAQGGAIVQEMPVAAFIVRLNSGAYAAIQGMPAILALEPYHAAFKLSPDIGRVALPDPQKATSDTYALSLRLFPGEVASVVAQQLTAIGVTVTKTYGDTVFVNAHRSKLGAVASIEAVQWITEDLPLFMLGEETTCTMQTGRFNSGAIPYHDAGVDGGGGTAATAQILMVLDSGIQVDAGDLSNTRTDGASTTPIGATHRKVLFYGTTNSFGGSGDSLGCDSTVSGGFTHGHTVSAIALGNATRVPGSYGAGWTASDINGNPWKLDGVAPRAKLVAYDATVTPISGGCDDPLTGTGISPGDLYNGVSTSALLDGYTRGARVVNFSWGSLGNVYDSNAADVDQFIFEHGDAIVFLAAGDRTSDTNFDGNLDSNTTGAPASAKNGVAVGASVESDDQLDVRAPNDRAFFSSLGPASATSGRISPILMAPGTDAAGGQGVDSEYNCRSSDNDQNNPVECDVVQNLSGTSYSAAAASGAALLVRDYFAQGLYPDGTSSNPGNAADLVPNVSASLVKAVLVASAQWMSRPTGLNPNAPGAGLTKLFRFNNEQGYGRIQLSGALPLQNFPAAVTGLIVADGGVPGGPNSTTLVTNLGSGGTTSTTLNICDPSQPLSIGMAWAEPSGDLLVKNLDLELVSPSGRKYVGNFYSDDTNRDGTLQAGENCDYTGLPWPPNSTGAVDRGPWSLPVAGTGVNCGSRTVFNETQNPVEGIHLTPDPAGNGIADDPATASTNEAADSQMETGTWTLTVKAGTFTGMQTYAVAIAGGVCLGSSVRIQKVAANGQLAGGTFVCNDSAVVTVDEIATAGDPALTLTPSEISSRTRVDVIDAGTDAILGNGDDVITDTEQGIALTDVDGGGPGLRFDSAKILLTDGTAPDPGNGALDVRSGQQIRVTYQDEEPNGTINTNAKRVNTGSVDCRTAISAGGVNFAQFGKDTFTLVSGGCERDARGYFTFGFPDRYMDAGETVGYLVAFQSAESSTTLQNVKVSLKAVNTDANSPVTCKPGSTNCTDPNRADNPPSSFITVLDSPKTIGTIAPSVVATVSFTVQASSVVSGVHKADMVIGVSAKTAGKAVESFAVQRETLNADETSFFYSTDFPTGGAALNYDINNNEILETVTNDPRSFVNDYFFETRSYSDMTVGGFNTTAALQAPWNFDTNDGGFTSGVNNLSTSTVTTLSYWGEDKNFNNKLDGFCTTNTTLPCTKGDPSQACKFCNNDKTVVCTVDGDCASVGGTCGSFGTCNYDLGEDRDPNQVTGSDVLDQNWSTNGGCGWQTNGAGATGGIWHTGSIRSTTFTGCLASGQASGRCQTYEQIVGDLNGQDLYEELLLTPILNKVNQCPLANGTNCPRPDGIGDPVYQVAITDWAWNQEINISDLNTSPTAEFDTDIDKATGADLYNDLQITSIYLFGHLGAISGGNNAIIGGASMFAPVKSCVDTDGKGKCSVTTATTCFTSSDCPGGETCINFLDHCATVAGAVCTHDYDCAGFGTSINGTVGGNRVGMNDCAFEGAIESDSTHAGNDSVKAIAPWGLATPPDDDAANGYCHRSDALNNIDKSLSCTSDIQCQAAGAPYQTTAGGCSKPDLVVDEFVTANGPGRNYGIKIPNGPDMRFTTLEDLYGDTGSRFRGAVGFINLEPTSETFGGGTSYGLGIDDMFVSWKETRLDEDSHTHCAGGQCADLEIGRTVTYDANGVLPITVADPSPYGTPAVNDCNSNGVYTDAVDDQDCDNDGARDVTVQVSSAQESPGEVVFLNETAPSSGIWKGTVPYSTTYDSPGTIFAARNGTVDPLITATYLDRNDGTGSPCKKSLDPAMAGQLQATTRIIVSSGKMTLAGTDIHLVGTPGINGDDDGFADTNETVDMFVSYVNKTGLPLDNVVVTLASSDPKIECISRPVASIGAMANLEIKRSTTAFRFKVASSANRANVNDFYQALFSLTVHSDSFDLTTRTQALSIDLDLSGSGGGVTQPFIEDFEDAAGLGKFTLETMDNGRASLALSTGFRCQYNNPDLGPQCGSSTCQNQDCFLGFPGFDTFNDWHVHKSSSNGVARAFAGVQSLHYGVHPSTSSALRDTYHFKQLDGIETIDPINLPVASGVPKLSFMQQVSFIDDRNVFNITPGESLDRGVVEVNAGGNWIKIYPLVNVYDEQGTDDFTNCEFDPTDDGNNEDSYFDPLDPNHRLGPSSTCFPEFSFTFQGNTDWRVGFNPSSIGRAEGPGLQGSVNVGTWVQPIFDLTPFAGRSIKLRFLASTIEDGEVQTWDNAFHADNVLGDDGWYIDNIHIDQALSAPVVLSVDSNFNTGLATCAACTDITAALTATPNPTAGPGQIVTLDASGSAMDACPNGIAQYQLWIDANGNGTIGDAGDALLHDFTDNARFVDAPALTTAYGVRVRCSTQPGCDAGGNSARLTVTVTCPSTGNALGRFTQPIGFSNKTTLSWGVPATVDVIRGDLAVVRSTESFANSVLACIADNQNVSSIVDSTAPALSQAFYYLVRPAVATFCNTPVLSWGDGTAKQLGTIDAQLTGAANVCP